MIPALAEAVKNIKNAAGHKTMKFDEERLKEIAKPYFLSARAGDW